MVGKISGQLSLVYCKLKDTSVVMDQYIEILRVLVNNPVYDLVLAICSFVDDLNSFKVKVLIEISNSLYEKN